MDDVEHTQDPDPSGPGSPEPSRSSRAAVSQAEERADERADDLAGDLVGDRAGDRAEDRAGDRAGPVKRSVTIAGHRTSITLEAAFWEVLREAARARNQSVNDLVREIDAARTTGGPTQGLSSAIRVYLLDWARTR